MPARRFPCRAAARKCGVHSATTIWAIFLAVVVLVVVAFLAGYRPLVKRRDLIAGEAREQEQALQRVEVIEVRRSADKSAIELPGNIEAITEAPILARADGYLERRMVDIGDRVRSRPAAGRNRRPRDG